MNPRHKIQTLGWCIVTMVATLALSHGHLIMREVLAHWPQEDSWEGRLETALYTQGGLAVVASCALSLAIFVRGWLARKNEDALARKELAMRERHERAAHERHEALLNSLSNLNSGTAVKKSNGSGIKPR